MSTDRETCMEEETERKYRGEEEEKRETGSRNSVKRCLSFYAAVLVHTEHRMKRCR